VYRREKFRWRTRFGRWVNRMTVASIVQELGRDPNTAVTPGAVYSWLAGTTPRPDRARALSSISSGRLSISAIYQHRSEMERLASQERSGRADQRRNR
jgi:hypothetical protein